MADKVTLNPEEELQFQRWMRLPGSNANAWYGSMNNYLAKVAPGEKADLSPPEYDYRGAFKAGAEPSVSPHDGAYHWTSEFKSNDHPTMWKEYFMRDYGVDPDDVGVSKEQYEFIKQMSPSTGNALVRTYKGGE